MLALSRIRHASQTALYIAKQRQSRKAQREVIRSLKRHLVCRICNLLRTPRESHDHHLLTEENQLGMTETDGTIKNARRVRLGALRGVAIHAGHLPCR